MAARARWSIRLGLLAALVLGLFCLNYTMVDGAEGHRQWASEHHLPEPGAPITYAGMILTVIGAYGLGYRLGRGRRRD